MGKLTTHVLDTMNGCPASGMVVTLSRLEGDTTVHELQRLTLNSDGRASGPLLEGESFQIGRYRLSFEVGAAFLEVVPLDFGLADLGAHYHVPLLVSPWSYSTYRGS
jgi:5-hydroxyisourate hydrolase